MVSASPKASVGALARRGLPQPTRDLRIHNVNSGDTWPLISLMLRWFGLAKGERRCVSGVSPTWAATANAQSSYSQRQLGRHLATDITYVAMVWPRQRRASGR